MPNHGKEQPGLPGSLKAPTEGHYVELDEGLLWIRLPIPGALHHINVWLLPTPQGWRLVDTGMRTQAVVEAWEALHDALPLDRAVEEILVTHHHPDHFGMAHVLSERWDVPAFMTATAHAATVAALAPAPVGTAPAFVGFARRTGIELDDDMRRFLQHQLYASVVSGPVPVQALQDGTRLADRDGDWAISVHEGHAPGHACLHHAGRRVLVSGDQLLPRISTNVSLYPSNEEADPLGQYLSSLSALSALPEETLVLPAHGDPFATLHARARSLQSGHEARLDRLLRALARPRSTLELARRLFMLERLDTLNRLLAITETLAHLRHLECRQQVERSGLGAELRWART